MDILNNLALGFDVAFSFQNLFYALLGVLLGTAVGVLPGLGPITTIALLLPITYELQPVSGLIMLAGIYYGAQYGGSTTSILVNLPGEASSVITTLDGYQMARKGRAGPALAVAAIGSFVAGCFGVVLIAVVAQPMTQLALKFGPWEFFSVMCFGLVGSVILASGSILKAIGMVLVDILIGMIGMDVNSGAIRFTMGSIDLLEGFEFTIIAMGIFGFGEIIKNLSANNAGPREVFTKKIDHLYPSRQDWRFMTPAIFRGTLVGTVFGVLPGAGALVSSLAAYTMEKRMRMKPGEVPFGQGNIRGVAAPESANNSAVQAAFIPMLTLGIPPNGTLALMLGAMTVHNIAPGPQVMTNNPDIFWGLVVSMFIGNVLLLVLNLPLVGIWVKMLNVPYRWLFPTIVLLCSIGVYSVSANIADVWFLSLFGLIGFVLLKLNCEPAPMLLGYILGPMLEENLRRAMLVGHGDWSLFVTRPISGVLLGLTGLLLVVLISPALLRKREQTLREED